MQCRMKVEIWVSGRECFMFRCETPLAEHWTFLVDRIALEDLAGEEKADPPAVFARFRSSIYEAARRRMQLSDPYAQHILSAQEINKAAAG
jgi:hypothetical protein